MLPASARPHDVIPAAANKALRHFATHTIEDALGQAERELASARRCSCCANALAHLRDRLGSTLFLDDDPEQLASAFPPDERDRFTPRLLAACILLYGRPRERP
jgi:hypothetical protein